MFVAVHLLKRRIDRLLEGTLFCARNTVVAATCRHLAQRSRFDQ